MVQSARKSSCRGSSEHPNLSISETGTARASLKGDGVSSRSPPSVGQVPNSMATYPPSTQRGGRKPPFLDTQAPDERCNSATCTIGPVCRGGGVCGQCGYWPDGTGHAWLSRATPAERNPRVGGSLPVDRRVVCGRSQWQLLRRRGFPETIVGAPRSRAHCREGEGGPIPSAPYLQPSGGDPLALRMRPSLPGHPVLRTCFPSWDPAAPSPLRSTHRGKPWSASTSLWRGTVDCAVQCRDSRPPLTIHACSPSPLLRNFSRCSTNGKDCPGLLRHYKYRNVPWLFRIELRLRLAWLKASNPSPAPFPGLLETIRHSSWIYFYTLRLLRHLVT